MQIHWSSRIDNLTGHYSVPEHGDTANEGFLKELPEAIREAMTRNFRIYISRRGRLKSMVFGLSGSQCPTPALELKQQQVVAL